MIWTATRNLLAVAALAAATWCATTVPSLATTDTGDLNLTVLSATNLDVSACAPNTPNVTSFGSILPGSSIVTSSACTVEFGSTNDTATLRLSQTDRGGTTMLQYPSGRVDTSFGSGGLGTAHLSNSNDAARGIAVAPDGSIVVAGNCEGTPVKMCVAKFTSSGAPDTSFSGDGKDQQAPGVGDSEAWAAAVQSDGKILIGGRTTNAGGKRDMTLLRYNTDGTLDTSFDSDGIVITDTFAAGCDEIYSVYVQPDDKILVGGGCMFGSGESTLVRYNPDGSLDTSFSGDGIQIVTYGFSSGRIDKIIPRDDGRFFTVGSVYGSTLLDIGVLAFNADGSLDTTWSGDGKDFEDPVGQGNDVAQGAAILSDGSLMVGAYAYNGTDNDFVVMKYNAGGNVDTSWGGGDGSIVYPTMGSGNSQLNDFLPQADGKFLLVGMTYDPGVSGYGAQLMRIRSDGTLDATFDGDGKLLYHDVTYVSEEIASADFDSNGRLILAGGPSVAGNQDFGVTAFSSASFHDWQPGSHDWSSGTSTFAACLDSIGGGASAGGSDGWKIAGSGNCTTALPANWNAIAATTDSAGAKVASSLTGSTASNIVRLRFGAHSSTNQRPGDYVAPLTFTVVAPA